MAISKKGRRQISVGERPYFWWVFDEYDQSFFDGVQLTIVAVDQEFFARYGVNQPDENRTLVFTLVRRSEPSRSLCPRFEGARGIVTPQTIRDIIEWCYEESKMRRREP